MKKIEKSVSLLILKLGYNKRVLTSLMSTMMVEDRIAWETLLRPARPKLDENQRKKEEGVIH